MTKRKRRVVVALGGNAILQQGQKGTYEEQLENVRQTAEVLGDMILSGDYQVVITHGNGPQVGAILLQNTAGLAEGVPAMPMHVCGAQSQGLIGYMIQQSLGDVFREAGREDIPVATIVTQLIVDKNDPAFQNPSKPVGPFYEEEEAKQLADERGWSIVKEADRGWRRVVPSPEPKDIAEKESIIKLLEAHIVPIVSGGGGIPVIKEKGGLRGVEAVIDKDLAAEKVAEVVDADALVILTDVNGVAINYGQPDEEWLEELTLEEAEKHMRDDQFAEGSMKPKVTAAVRFVKSGGEETVIASLGEAEKAIKGETGTKIIE
ncbi:carbamate kinase [candidate division MSBL1 archaeon SCGC-AAA833F18]|uniref:Carbamate kinase n=2 Tax=candidate division MSBL1 TaxID=215777 RepID=A0A133UZ66_9EURY|nr:carbamate kinase [candidate division MSBL1 archaeon SCGC-AAA261C02]KXB09246.1 carbamate kinase [candidate division MSBL1 archaeon SCGC-AAA833F18]